MIKKFSKPLYVFLIVLLIVFTAVLYTNKKIPDSVLVFDGKVSHINSILPVSVSFNKEDAVEADSSFASPSGSGINGEARLFGILPVKKLTLKLVDKPELLACGNSFGVKMFSAGILVVGQSNIMTAEGARNPAKEADIRVKDIILEMDGKKMTTIESLAALIENSNGKPISAVVDRGGQRFTTELKPVKSTTDGKWKVGMWVRDSTAGIGTMTFYDPKTKVFAGLGHGICDIDTGEIIPLSKGQVLYSSIISVQKGKKGSPGELKGVFTQDTIWGTLLGNSSTGIYGKLDVPPKTLMSKPVPIALRDEIVTGPAKIYCMVEGDVIEEFDIEITRVFKSSLNTSKNMTIKVTDQDLIEKTGGIVQGMSGSPIIQNGKLIGAVTHVLVNDPTHGFGIFIEEMLNGLENLSSDTKVYKN